MVQQTPPESSGNIARPTPDQPGTLMDQIQAIVFAIYLGDRRRTNAQKEWQDARGLVMPHARREVQR